MSTSSFKFAGIYVKEKGVLARQDAFYLLYYGKAHQLSMYHLAEWCFFL